MNRTIILDSSAILHNWHVLAGSGKVVIPHCALLDIEKFQNEPGDVGDNARGAAHYLSGAMSRDRDTRLFFWPGNGCPSHNERILQTAVEVQGDKRFFNDEIVILTKLVSLRALAGANGVLSEDYDDVGLVEEISGWREMPVSVEEMEEILSDKDAETFRLEGREGLAVNEYVVCTVEGERCRGMIYRHLGNGVFRKLDLKPHLCGIVPRNEEQVMLANSLYDPGIHLVSAIGRAGSGKTLIALAAALQQVVVKHFYKKIIITRPIMPVGRDLGYLPGDVNEKMSEWIRPFMNNLEFIRDLNDGNGKRKLANSKIASLMNLSECKDTLEVLPITYIRGSSINNSFIIVDEAQNATPSEMKTIITRAGEGSKIVIAGDIDQIDNRFLSHECNGLTMVVKKFWNQPLYSHVTLTQVERSPLADLAANLL